MSAFAAALAIQVGLYARMLRPALLTGDVDQARPAVKRWLLTTIALQAGVLVAAGVYVLVTQSGHPRGVAWISPALGAVIGTALPLQVAVVSILRAGKQP